MIHVDRDRLDSQGRPIRPSDAWFQNAEALTRKAKEERGGHVVQEHVYRHPSVKVALEELFHRKCAYCETPLSEIGWQVEHFRPKGRVAGREDDHPGYYWLAYDWSNLYPSCAPCNQSLEDKPLWDDPGIGKAAGKADQFPIEDEDRRAMSHQEDLTRESPLLLDPCTDDPERCLRYNPLGEIEPSPDDVRAKASLEVFNLTRRRLRDRRKEQMDLVVLLLRLVRQRGDTGLAAELESKLFADSAPFAGAARFIRSDPDAFGV